MKLISKHPVRSYFCFFWGSWIALAALATTDLSAAHLTGAVVGSYALTFIAVPFVRCAHCRCLIAIRFISPLKQLRLVTGRKIPCPKCTKLIS